MACSLMLGACTDEITINCPTYTLERVTEYDGYELVWAEEFEENGLPDEKVWGYEEGYQRNDELQDYRKADLNHSWVEDGKLILQAFKDPHEGTNRWTGEPYHFEFSSASVKSQKKQDFMYGRIDIAAKIPIGRGVWSALWLMPTQNKYKDGYGEIDIMEYVWGNGNEHNSVYQTIHTQNTRDEVDERPASWCSSNTLDFKFHLYSVVWEKNSIEILFDNKVILTYQRDKKLNSYKQWPFDQPFYLIMNIAVGGGWGGTWGVDESIFPARMEVEYVRYYTKIQNGGDDEDKEEEVVNLIKNGNFETAYSAGEEPVLVERYQIENEKLLDYLNRWNVMKATGTELFVDDKEGANDTKHSLSFKSPKIPNWWSTDVAVQFADVPAGKHTLSFYAKSDKAASAFALSFTLADVSEKDYRNYKTLVNENGKTVVKQIIGGDLYPTMVESVENTWKKYSLTLDIPKNDLKDGLVRLVIKPHTSGTLGSNNYKLVSSDAVQFWFDEFVLEEGEGKNEGGDGGKEETLSLIQNPGFEKDFATDKEPVVGADAPSAGNGILNYLNRWFTRGKTGTLTVDKTFGANGSGQSLKYTVPELANYWSTDLSYPFQGVTAGKYKLSFYTKCNQDKSPFVLSVTVCENDADIARLAKFQKTIVLKDGEQTIEYKEGQNDIWATMVGESKKDWIKHEVTVDIPANKLVKLVFKPHVSADERMSSDSYKITKVTNLEYWFDEFAMEKVN